MAEKLRRLRLSLVSLFFGVLFSGNVTAAGVWSEWLNVKEVYPYNTGYILASFSEVFNPHNCPSGHIWVRLNVGNLAKGEIYSALLSALATGQQVKVFTDACTGGYVKLLHLRIKAP